jgi:hypothetical protein
MFGLRCIKNNFSFFKEPYKFTFSLESRKKAVA